MFKNYFKVAFRNLLRNKGFSLINISGLAIGMASAMLILLWVQYQVSHDRFHAKLDRLYQVWSNDVIDGSIRSLTATPEIMAPDLKKDYPEIEGVTRVSWTQNLLSDGGEKKLESVGAVVDPDFLTMFSFPLLQGNINTALSNPHSIVITEKLAKKFFNNVNPIGKTIRMGNATNYTVTGLLKNIPSITQFSFIEYLASYVDKTQANEVDKDWTDISIPTFVLLKPGASPVKLGAKIKKIIPTRTNGAEKSEEFLYPMSQTWLYSQFENGKPVGGVIDNVRMFSIVAVFILLIACINFMNLSTARSEKRAKEVGVRKVAGALKRSLIAQFLIESILLTSIAGVLAIMIVQLSIPAFNRLMVNSLEINYENIYFWLYLVAFILITGILAGSYPAFFLSSFKPVTVLKGGFKKINALVTPRKILVILQFTFAIVLIICTIIVTQQVKYAQERQSGYERDHLVHVFMEGEIQKNFHLIKNDLLNQGIAVSVAATNSPLTQNWSSGIGLKWEGKDPNLVAQVNRYTEESDLIKTAGMKLIEGRDIDIKNYPSDSTACIINESAAKLMKFKNPIGQIITDEPSKWHVIGVIKDFIQESPYAPIKPMIIRGPKEWLGTVLIKLNGKTPTAKNIAGMEKIFNQYNAAYPFSFVFTDEDYAQKFLGETQTKKLATLFAGLTIFISCLGLFGLATYMAESRTKEIGIRKVLGASVTSITTLLSRDFVKLVCIAVMIASPLAYWAASRWLDDFNYHITISLWVFVSAGLLAILIALITVSYQSIRAAISNPTKSLRSE
ncbi:MAG: ABC transporter permease [Bacteroidetes bacterium]|nr:ABC transporter permease [Bacteroidota bacterium]